MARRLAHSLSFIFFNICAHVVRSQIVDQCQAPIEWNNATHKREYTVGVLAIRGFPAAYSEFNKTFTEYLTETAGKMFNPPVRFQMKALDFLLLFTDTATANVDFFYVNPSAFSCIESEYGASSLVSQISERIVDGQVYKLTKFGGVIFSLSNSTINTVEDLKDRSIAAASISGLGSGQMQFRVLQQAGLSYINDPSQVVFTSDQGSVVSGVINGDWDVGFVRTDQIESTLDADGKPIDRTLLKVIDPIKGLEIDGNPFPFASSTPLYAEWNVAALPHVSDDASIAVQNALLKLEAHASAGVPIVQCYTDRNCNGTNSYASPEECQQSCHDDFFSNPIRCDTTPELAVIAQMARSTGKYSGWRSTLSYMDLRNMQEETGFIVKNPENGTMQCIRSSNIYDAIVCPPGHFKKSEYEVINSCINMGLGCKEGYQCVCKPCVKAFDVDIFANPVSASLTQHFSGRTGCDKFAICGSVQQTKTIQFAAVDNKKRDNLNLVVRLHEGSTPRDIKGVLVPDSNYTYVFSLETNRVGVVVMQIFADNQQIPESPLRVSVVPRDCALDYNDGLRVPDSEGECVCSANSVQMGARCVSIAILIPSILVPLLVVAGVVIYLYIERKKKQADSVWAVKVNELLFDDPPLIIGRGTFGLVLLAEYRGTQVAVKRVIPPKFELKSKVHQSVQRASFLGSGDMEDISDEFSGTLSGNFVNTSDTTTAVVSNSHNKHQHEFGEGEIVGDTNQLQEKQLNECAVDTSAPTDNPDIENELGPGNADQHASQFNLERSKSEGETVLTQTKKKVAWAVNKTRRASLNLDSCNIEEHKQKQSLPTRRASCIPFGSASIPSSDSLGNLKVNAFGPFKTRKADTKRSALDIAFDFDQDTVERRLSYQGDQKTESIQKVADVGTQIGSSLEVEMGTAVEEIGDNIKTSNMTSSDFRDVQPNQGVESAWTSGWADVGKGTESDFRSGWGSAGMLSKQSTLYNSSLKPSKPSSSGNRKGIEKIKKFVTFGRKDEYNKLKADFISEMRHLSKLRHPCITTVMGAVISKFDEPMLVMEYMDHGSLYDILHNETMVVDGELLLPILRDIAQGVRFLHTAEPQVIHGDLKAQNVLVDGKFRAKVADFGLSQKKKVGATGTPYWMAPELLRGERPNNAATDVYSFGIILYEAYSRKDPYEGESYREVIRAVADPVVNKRPPVPKSMPPTVVALMSECLSSNPSSRPTFEELDQRLKRLDVSTVEPGRLIYSHQRKKDQMVERTSQVFEELFPRHVAQALREGRKVEPEHFDLVTIFFSDIVGFTDISSTIDASKVSDMLDRLYIKFDELSEVHDVFKIETIGDAYICVTNLVKTQSDHASRIAKFAIDAIKAANETLIDLTQPELGYVNIRVGFHSGPVVANVVGSRHPKYTIFGDTVNTASRMESNSIKNRIQCSEVTAKLVKEQDPSILLNPRGPIHVKGKGQMNTFWINEIESSIVTFAEDKRVSEVSLNKTE